MPTPRKGNTLNVYVLPCDHTVLIRYNHRPLPGDWFFCYLCEKYMQLKKVKVKDEWNFTCITCNHTRYFGADESSAIRRGNYHALRNVLHVVVVRQGLEVINAFEFYEEELW